MPTITTVQAAELLGMTPQGVRLLIKNGHLKADRVGRDYLLKMADVEAAGRNRPRKGRPPGPKPKKSR